ncbi:conserved membrane hypothetical protein [Gammaproteobacteria bacterium]
MKSLFHYAVDLCLLRLGPQDAPASWGLLRGALIGNILVGLLLIPNAHRVPAWALLESTTDALLMLGMLYLGLRLVHLETRFAQSGTALMLSNALLGLIILPLASTHQGILEDIAELTLLMFLLVVGWSFVVFGHILRHTFNLHLPLAFLLAFVYTLFSWLVLGTLFPRG